MWRVEIPMERGKLPAIILMMMMEHECPKFLAPASYLEKRLASTNEVKSLCPLQ